VHFTLSFQTLSFTQIKHRLNKLFTGVKKTSIVVVSTYDFMEKKKGIDGEVLTYTNNMRKDKIECG
jgi:hypothetical protein